MMAIDGGLNGAATADYIATAAQRDIPSDVIEQAKMCLVEPVLGARARPLLQALRDVDQLSQLSEVTRLVGGRA